jgi:hypothetical protein
LIGTNCTVTLNTWSIYKNRDLEGVIAVDEKGRELGRKTSRT